MSKCVIVTEGTCRGRRKSHCQVARVLETAVVSNNYILQNQNDSFSGLSTYVTLDYKAHPRRQESNKKFAYSCLKKRQQFFLSSSLNLGSAL